MAIHQETGAGQFPSQAVPEPQSSSEFAIIPDLFESFMSRAPEVNSHYYDVGEEAMIWIADICGYTETDRKRLRKADFAYFAAIAFPDASPTKLRTVTDWFNWVFAFDDQLDDGLFDHRKVEALQYINGMLAVVKDVHSSESDRLRQPARYCLKTIWQRLQNVRAKARWARHMVEYFEALRDSINFKPSELLEDTIEQYMRYRLYSIAVTPIFSFLEYACNIRLPDEIFEHESMIEIERIGVELQMLANDCVSYHRERDLGCVHNIVHLFLHHGLSLQEAYNRVHFLMRERYKRWYMAQASLPIWGEEIDSQLRRYIKGIEDVALANAHWR
ncbi:hypothetical protein W97_07179 [Coniosporium apollinis CBS 100218]|uniref:Terpene synthase n=1 Tax=Coniosporium apollinis (strain CBS 100218) TaxID=1168221 RepID=R7Z287_CONA1|nr:uncharacterized protein W97_07179 [Coniosporium apollinis CBS 100218]EON68031.1 hypothetical protein W97_07179 [Coniosporium apollinis CBS 100218]